MSNELVGTCDWLLDQVYDSHLLERGHLDSLVATFTQNNPYGDASALADFLVKENVLTHFQSERVLEGEARSLVMGPYLLSEAVGTGSTGTVYKALGKADRQPYAVKVLPMRSLWNVRQARKQVRSFADVPANPVVVPFVDVGTAAGKHYLVWPFVSGTTLEGVVQLQGALSWTDSANVALQLAQGLQVCHEHGLFHGLIKPSNVMIGDAGTVHLLDFGIGALLSENTDESLLDTMSTSNATMGMLDCASPESILDPRKRSFAGDQYSLGCVLYFCLAGKYPFPDGNLIAKMTAHQTKAPPPITAAHPPIPAQLMAIVERLLQKTPGARYSSMGEGARALRILVDEKLSVFQRRLSISNTPGAAATTAALEETPHSRTGFRHPAFTPPTSRPKTDPLMPAITPPPSTLSKASAVTMPRRKSAPTKRDSAKQAGLPGSEAPRRSWLSRLGDALAFWRPRLDSLFCSILAPPLLHPGESITLPIFAHRESTEEIRAIGRTYFPTRELISTVPLRRDLPRGANLIFHVVLPGLTLDPPAQTLIWRGELMPLPFTIAAPADFRPGEVAGVVSIADGADIICNGEFRVIVERTK